jgi:hypothetical protein
LIITRLLRLMALAVPCLLMACSGGGSESVAPSKSSVACQPRVGVWASTTQGEPDAASSRALAELVSRVQQSGADLGYTLVNKVRGAEEAGSVHYSVFFFLDTLTYRLVDNEIGTALPGAAGTALDASSSLETFLRKEVRAAIDRHDQVTSGSGVPASLAAGACADLTYLVNTQQGRVNMRASIGSLTGSLQADGSSSVRVSHGKAEGLRISVPAGTPPGEHSISVQSVCRYDPGRPIATLTALPVTVTPATTAAVSVSDDFFSLDGSVHHQFRLTSGSYLLGVNSSSGDQSVFMSGQMMVSLGGTSGAVFERASVVAHDNCFSAGCTTVTIEGTDSQGAARSVAVEAGPGLRLTVDSANHGFARVTGLRLVSLEASFSRLRATGTAGSGQCSL